jgi:hypothetical protein
MDSAEHVPIVVNGVLGSRPGALGTDPAMSDATRMLLAVPSHHGIDTAVLGECIEATLACAQSCTACADACLDEYNLQRDCIVACHTCADVCNTTARLLSRSARWDRPTVTALVDAAARACSVCAGLCEQHADTTKHCGVCADACRRAEKACQQLITAFAALVA